MDTRIKLVHARHLIDCKTRGILEVEITTNDGVRGRGSSPTGTSVGSREAMVMRDNDPKLFLGSSVYKAVDLINEEIAQKLIGMDVVEQKLFDEFLLNLDGTENKSKLGGNVIFALSAACLDAAAKSHKKDVHQYLLGGKKASQLPIPIINMFNGGSYRDFSMQFQEFGVIPYKAQNMQEAINMGVTIFSKVGELVKKKQNGFPPGIANYFGHMPISDDPMDLFQFIDEAVESCGYKGKVCYYTDIAASEFYDSEKRTYNFMGKEIDSDELIGYVRNLTSRFPFYGVEDILFEDDFQGFTKAKSTLKNTNIIGDDLICSNIKYLQKAIELDSCSGIVLKPNQVGTITECMATVNLAKSEEVLILPSVRAGGMVDDIVKEIAVAIEAPLVKCGAPRSGERISFLNTLMRAGDEYPEARLAVLKGEQPWL